VVAHRGFARCAAIRESAEATSASNGWPGLWMSMTSGLYSEVTGFPFRTSLSISAQTTRCFNGVVTRR